MAEFKLTKGEKDSIRSLFTPYLFYKKGKDGIECWCNRCQEHFVQPFVKRLMIEKEIDFIREVRHNEEVRCPRCGEKAIAKSTRKAKSCQNLWEEQRVVVIHRLSENEVVAESYWCWANYIYSYLPVIELRHRRRYELTPGKAVCSEWSNYGGCFYRMTSVIEPFQDDYTVIGLDKLQNTFMRYHQLPLFDTRMASRLPVQKTYSYAMKYLCYFAIYPQLEMLQKIGCDDIVKNLIYRNRKGDHLLNWKASSVHGFFKMSKQDYRQFVAEIKAVGKSEAMGVLAMRRYLRKQGWPADFPHAVQMLKDTHSVEYLKETVELFEGIGEDPRDGVQYLLRQCKKSDKSFWWVKTEFKDYRDMAKRLKLGADRVVLYPPDLLAAHDRAAAMERAILEEKERKKNEKLLAAYVVKHQANMERYAFEMDGYIITVPATAQAIIDEGKAMKHCVGGYAERHLRGKLTILFLRKADQPEKSLYTIEMHEDRLTQVQGYNNRTPLTPEAKAVFDTWLQWVKAGSRRP